MSALGIKTYDGEVKGMRRGGKGRAPSAETLELRTAIEASAKTGKARVWPGAAQEYKKNAQKVRNEAWGLKTADAPHGFHITVGISGQDLTFRAQVKADPEAKPETTQPTTEKPTPARPAKKVAPTPRKAAKR